MSARKSRSRPNQQTGEADWQYGEYLRDPFASPGCGPSEANGRDVRPGLGRKAADLSGHTGTADQLGVPQL